MMKAVPTSRAAAVKPASVAKPSGIAHQAKLAATAVALSAGLVSPAFAGVSLGIPSGATLASPTVLDFSVEGMKVQPAAQGLAEGTGHFHLLIDEPVPEKGVSIPFDDSHKHYGQGQTSDTLILTPGQHSLVLQFANANHESYGPDWAQTVDVDIAP